MLRLAAAACCAEIQHSVVYYVTDQCRKRQQAYIHAEGGHSEHLLSHFLSDIPIATHHSRLFSEPPTTTHNWLFSELQRLKERNEMKFCNSQVSVVTFYVGSASGLQFVFFSDNIIIRSMCC